MTIYAMVGPSGAGKTTLARELAKQRNAIIVSRDYLREGLFGYEPHNVGVYYDRPDLNSLEKIVSKYEKKMIQEAIKLNKDVIVDNTHLKAKYLDDLKKFGVPVVFLETDVNLETAISRDGFRQRVVGEDVIKKQFQQFEHLRKTYNFDEFIPEPISPIHQAGLGQPSAFIFDLDSTLAIHNGRSPYDYSKVLTDTVNDNVRSTLYGLHEAGYDILICSGRPDSAREDSLLWLEQNDIPHHGIWMRKTGDNRKDFIVKEELWREIAKKYYIVALFDDRRQVIDHARKLGLTVFDVANNEF